MKAEIKLLAASIVAFGVIVGTSNVAFSTLAQSKIAVVDVSKVVAKSSQVQALKKEQVQKSKNLAQWLKTANADVAKQQSKENKEKLAKKYQQDLAKKRNANQQDYAKKLADIDKNISATISQQAKLKGYTLVLSKSVVLFGGDDITAEISKVVK